MTCILRLAFPLLAGALTAQTYVIAGDNRLTLNQLLHDHPEGMILTLPSGAGQSLSTSVQKALDQDPALELQLETQEAERKQRVGRELLALRGWGPEKPHWALLGPDGQVHAEGTEAPTAERLVEIYSKSPLRSRAERLRDFLKLYPDHAEALAQLVLELRALAERRTEKILGQLKPEANGATPITTTLLSEADDARLWSEYAEHYEQLMRGNVWPGAMVSGASSPLPLAAQLSTFAEHSPLLRELAARLIPEVESRLRGRLTDERRWKVWLSLRQAGAGGRPGDLLVGTTPPPGTKHWPPSAALDAFVEDAQARADWRDAEPVLQAAYDRNQDLLHALDAAAKEDAAGPGTPDLGTHFGFGGWTGETALLAEAKLRLGKLQEADHIFREAFARRPKPEIALEAAALARRCGKDTLADQWAQLGH